MGGGWWNALVMPISDMQKVIPVLSLSDIITGTTFSYAVSTSVGSFSLFKVLI